MESLGPIESSVCYGHHSLVGETISEKFMECNVIITSLRGRDPVLLTPIAIISKDLC